MKTTTGTPGTGAGSVLEDLRFEQEEVLEIQVKAQLYRGLLSNLQHRSLTQAQMSELLGIHQPDVSRFLNGHISKFSIGQMIRFAGRLQMEAEVSIHSTGKRPVRSAESLKQVRSRRVKTAC